MYYLLELLSHLQYVLPSYSVHYFVLTSLTGDLHFMLQVQVLIELLIKRTGHPVANTKFQVALELCVSRVVFVYCIIG